MNRTRLLSGTALIGLLTLVLSGQAMAACDINVPTAGQTVTCSGADTTGISGGANNVTVNLGSSGSISTSGIGAIALGTGAQITTAASSTVTSNLTTISLGTGNITLGGTSISSTTGMAIQYANGGGVYWNAGNISGTGGTAIDFGTGSAIMQIGSFTGTITGKVMAGAGTNDILRFSGSSNKSFNASDIGTQYTGFEKFQMSGSGTWTLTGTGNQAWTVNSGILQGDTTSMSGNLAISSGANATFSQATNGTYASVISGAGSVTKAGTGNITFTGTNTYSGGTTISAGTLNVSADNNLGGSGAITLNNGTLQYGMGFASTRNVALGSSGSTIDTNGNNSTLSGIVSGSGKLNKTGSGTLTLSGTNTYTGGTNVTSGILSISADANLGTSSNALTINGGTLQATAGFTANRNWTIGASGGTIDVTGASNLGLAAGTIGTGTLTKTGTGVLTFFGGMGHTGGTIINGGILSGTTGLINSDVTDNATLQFYQSTNGTYSKVVSGTGMLTKGSSGTVTLTGVNTYSGGTNIFGGALNVSADNNLGDTAGGIQLTAGKLQYGAGFSSARNILLSTGGGTIDTNGFDSTLSGAISGTTALTKTGSGILTLSGTSTYTGGTTITSGKLSITNDNNLGGTGTLTLNGGTLQTVGALTSSRSIALGASNGSIDTNGFDSTFSGVFSGAGALTKTGSGTLTLSGTNTYTGGTSVTGGKLSITNNNNLGGVGTLTLNSGTLQTGAALTSSRNVALGASNGTIATNGFDSTFSGVFSGTGALTKTSTGILTLSGTNTYTGGTTISAGTLNISNDNNLGGTGTLTLNGGTLQSGSNYTLSRGVVLGASNGTIDTGSFFNIISGDISGTGSLTKIGSGTLKLTGINTYTGGTTVSAGILSGLASKLIGDITDNATVNFDQPTNGTYSGVISGTGSVTKTSAGTVTLSGTNTYTGGTSVTAGILKASADANLGSTSGALTLDGGTFQYGASFNTSRSTLLGSSSGTIDTNSFDSTLSGVMSGTGGLAKSGTGTLTLSGTNTYSGGTTVSAGSLSATSDTNLGSGGITLSNGGRLISNTAGANFTKTMSLGTGGGQLYNASGNIVTFSGVLSGTGSLTKIGSNSIKLTGVNTYTGGTIIDGSDSLIVSADNNLGNASGNITFFGGDGTNTLLYAAAFDSGRNIILSSNGIINTATFNSTLSGVISGAGTLKKTGTGTLTLSGTNTYTGGTNVTGGTLAVSGNQNMGATSGTLTLDNGTLMYNAFFSSSRDITLGAGGGTFLNNAGGAATLTGVISGAGALTKSGSNTFTLTGANTYMGGTNITVGVLRVSADNNLGDASGAINISSAQLGYDAGFSSARNITLTGFGGFDTNSFNSGLSGVISGTSIFNKNGLGTLTLSGTNTYSGTTNLNAGILAVSSDANLGAASGILNLNGGTLQSAAAFSSSRHLTLGASNGTVDTNGFDITLSGLISSTGSLTKTGTGTLTLSGTNTYTGGTTISAGTLNISNNNNLGGTGNLTLNGGALQAGSNYTLSRNTVLGSSGGTIDTGSFFNTVSGDISGTGSLTKTGSGTLKLTGTNTYTGGTIVSGGTLSGSTAKLIGDITDNATVNFDQATNGTYSGVISGTGAVTKTSAGTVTLSGTNTYTGGTTVSGGILKASAESNLGAVSGSLTLDGGTFEYVSAFDSARNITLNAGGGTITNSSGGTVTLSGVISGAGSFTKTGTNSVFLTGSNTYMGGTFLVGGSALQISADNNLGDASGGLSLNSGQLKYLAGFSSARDVALLAGGGLFDTNGFDSTLTGAVSGTGALTKLGAGTLTLTGNNNYSGGTTISAGSLAGNTDSLQGNILDNANLIFDQASAGTYSNAISGTGSLTKTGAGNLILSGTNTYSGGTTVSDGRLSVNGTIAGVTTIASGGTLGGNGNFGTLINNGHIAPGNSIGTMHVTGPVTFNSGSVYDVEVDNVGNSDKIMATGAVTINGGTVSVHAVPGTYSDTNTYNNILQGSSRTGTFDGVTSDLAFLTPTLSYTATAVNLALNRNDVDFSVAAEDPVQAGVADAVEDLGSGNDLYQAFAGLNMNEASQALNTLSGEHNAGLVTAAMQSSAVVRNIISNRIETISGTIHQNQSYSSINPVAGGDDDNSSYDAIAPSAPYDEEISIHKNFWSEAFGSYGHSDAQNTAPSQNRNSAGVLFGADAQPGDDFSIGAFGGWEQGEIYTDSQMANSDVDSWHAGFYANNNITPDWRISASLAASFQNIDTTRHIEFTGFSQTAKGETDGYTISPSLETGYAFNMQHFSFEPFVGITLTHSHVSAYTENQGGSANLDVQAADQTNLSHTLGVRFEKEFSLSEAISMDLNGRLAWNHTYGDLGSTQEMRFADGNLPFDVQGASLSENSAQVGIGADFNFLGSDAIAYVDYSGNLSTENTDQSITLGVRVPF